MLVMSMAAMEPRGEGNLELLSVSRSFAAIEVLSGISLSVGPGQIAAVRGANGSGKTTALRIGAGVLTPDGGSVFVCGAAPRSGASAFVPAGDRMLHWRLTGRQEVGFFAGLSGVGDDEVIHAALGTVGATEFADRRVGECSTGQRRRLMIAAALVTRAPVLFIDEPFADLDSDGRLSVDQAFRAWTGAGGAVLYAAPEPHDGPEPDLAFEIAGGALVAGG
jgi:Cu-processing system ATP-binding protein